MVVVDQFNEFFALVFENKDKIVLVMQYASGGELYDYVSYHKVLTDSDARRLFRQIATAIYYCHKVKTFHCSRTICLTDNIFFRIKFATEILN